VPDGQATRIWRKPRTIQAPGGGGKGSMYSLWKAPSGVARTNLQTE